MSTTLFINLSPSAAGGYSVISYTSRTACSTRRSAPPSPATCNTPFARRISRGAWSPANPSSPSTSAGVSSSFARRSQSAPSSHVSNARTSTKPSTARHVVRIPGSCTSEGSARPDVVVGANRSAPLAQNPRPAAATAGGGASASAPSVGFRPRRPATVTAPWLSTCARFTTLLVARTTRASAFMPATVRSTSSRSASETRSVLLRTRVSAKAICNAVSLFSRSCLWTLEASTSVTTASRTAQSSSRSSSSTQSSCATGPGSARPVVSRRMKSNLRPVAARRSSRLSMVWMRLPLTVQHTQPLFISTHSSTAASPSGLSCTSIFSTPSSAPNSFRMTATR